jgi:type II secretory pathway component PulF
MTADELIALNEQIAGMAKAGLPLDRGLAGLAREMGHGRLRAVTSAIAQDLESGTPLPDAVERRRSELPPYYASLITAGIRTGRLPEVLATLSAYARTIAVTRAIVVESLIYPTVVISLAFLLLTMLLYFIVPQFDGIFTDFRMSLPALTEFVLIIGRNPWPTAEVVGSLVIIAAILWVIGHATPAGRRGWARFVYSIPVVGTLIRSARLAAFSDLLAVLVEYEMPLPEAVRLAGEASSDPLMAYRTAVVHDRLVHGTTFGASLRGLGLLPEWVAWMAGAGEQRGALAPALRQIANVYRRQVEARAALLQSILPAFMIIGTAGLVVGVFVIALMLPLIKLIEGLSK